MKIFESPLTIVRGEQSACVDWLQNRMNERTLLCVLIIAAGCGLYGAAIGAWRAPELALYVAIKFPLLIYLTLLINGLMNGMLAQVLGTGLTLRQSIQCQLMSFMVLALILGSLSPIALGMALNAPEPDSDQAASSHRMQLLVHTALIAYAGIVSNHRMFRMLIAVTKSRALALRTLLAWLAGNLFVGAQISWNLRPFFGSPHIEVQFLRDDPFNGSFYETIFGMLVQSL